jgi:hypothetical protein
MWNFAGSTGYQGDDYKYLLSSSTAVSAPLSCDQISIGTTLQQCRLLALANPLMRSSGLPLPPSPQKKTRQRALLSHASGTDLSPPATPFARNWKADCHLAIVGRPIGRS